MCCGIRLARRQADAIEPSLAAQAWTIGIWTLVRQSKCSGATAVADATCHPVVKLMR
jgi:hypothetical protein